MTNVPQPRLPALWSAVLLLSLGQAGASYYPRPGDHDPSDALVNNYWSYETMVPLRERSSGGHVAQGGETELSLLLRMLGRFSKRGDPSTPLVPARSPAGLLYESTYRPTAGREVSDFSDPMSGARAPPYEPPSNVYQGRISMNDQANVAYLVIRCSERERPECFQWLRQRFQEGSPSSTANTWLYNQILRSQPRDVAPWENWLPLATDYGNTQPPQKRHSGAISIDTALRVIPVARYSTPEERKAASLSTLETLGRR